MRFCAHLTSLDRTLLSTSVCPSVRLSNACTLTKRNNRMQICRYLTIERFFQFLEAKFRGPMFRGSPRTSVLKTGRQLRYLCCVSLRVELGVLY